MFLFIPLLILYKNKLIMWCLCGVNKDIHISDYLSLFIMKCTYSNHLQLTIMFVGDEIGAFRDTILNKLPKVF